MATRLDTTESIPEDEEEAPAPEVSERFLPPNALNDRPIGPDQLNFDRYADAFARILCNPDTETPLTIGLYGAWGMGKSFLMKKIKQKVKAHLVDQEGKRKEALHGKPIWKRLVHWFRKRIKRIPSEKTDFHLVEFNAWVYSGSESLWAGLVTHLYAEIEKYLGWRSAYFRLSENFRRSARRTLSLLALFGLLGFGFSWLLDYNKLQESWSAARFAINGLSEYAARTVQKLA
jgi:predicted ATPase